MRMRGVPSLGIATRSLRRRVRQIQTALTNAARSSLPDRCLRRFSWSDHAALHATAADFDFSHRHLIAHAAL
jgi:hypothetical protein